MTDTTEPKRYHIPLTPAVLAAYQMWLEWAQQEREKEARQEAAGEDGQGKEAGS